MIRRLEAAGAILAAKLAMVELAGGSGYRQPRASFTGPASVAVGRDAWSGGSSSGSASAVAAGLVPFALGSETWGRSSPRPANCGVTGLRPTLGRVSRHGAMALSWSLDKVGPLGAHRRRLRPRPGGHRGRRSARSQRRGPAVPLRGGGSAGPAVPLRRPPRGGGRGGRRRAGELRRGRSTCCGRFGTVEDVALPAIPLRSDHADHPVRRGGERPRGPRSRAAPSRS